MIPKHINVNKIWNSPIIIQFIVKQILFQLFITWQDDHNIGFFPYLECDVKIDFYEHFRPRCFFN